ncbi:MAG TPA: hypothetical protein VEZ90_17710, partial [Blastocatellia bacterium]|nr:hypothetical protein [Blastocatellia bacterium]
PKVSYSDLQQPRLNPPIPEPVPPETLRGCNRFSIAGYRETLYGRTSSAACTPPLPPDRCLAPQPGKLESDSRASGALLAVRFYLTGLGLKHPEATPPPLVTPTLPLRGRSLTDHHFPVRSQTHKEMLS